MGATPLNEQYVLYNEVAKILDAKKIHIYKSYVGNYLTSMDMMGASLAITKLDDELKRMHKEINEIREELKRNLESIPDSK